MTTDYIDCDYRLHWLWPQITLIVTTDYVNCDNNVNSEYVLRYFYITLKGEPTDVNIFTYGTNTTIKHIGWFYSKHDCIYDKIK